MAVQINLVAVLEGHTDRVWSVAWNHNGTTLASCSGDKSARLWRQEGPQFVCVAKLDDGHQRTIRSAAFSPDSRFLATASFDATTGIWERNTRTGEYELLANLEGHENELKCVSWAASGALLATCSRDKSVWIWEVEADNDFECAAVLQEHTQDVKMVQWHPSDELLASCSYDDTIKIWREDGNDWYCAGTLTGHTSTVWAIAFDTTGERLVSVSDDKTMRIWRRFRPNNTEGVPVEGFESKWICVSVISGYHQRAIYSVAWSPLNIIATVGGDNSLHLFALNEAASTPLQESYVHLFGVEQAHSSDINCVRFSPADPSLLVTAGDDRLIKFWKIVQ